MPNTEKPQKSLLREAVEIAIIYIILRELGKAIPKTPKIVLYIGITVCAIGLIMVNAIEGYKPETPILALLLIISTILVANAKRVH